MATKRHETDRISDSLKEFISELVLESVLDDKPLSHLDYLKRFCEAEGCAYDDLVENLNLLVEVLKEYRSEKSPVSLKLAKHQAKYCHLPDGFIDGIPDRFGEKRTYTPDRGGDIFHEIPGGKMLKDQEEEDLSQAESLFKEWKASLRSGSEWSYDHAHKNIHLLIKSAELGYARAQITLAKAIRNRMGIERNDKEAFKWALAAARQDAPGGCFLTGLCYLMGDGVKPDDDQAFFWIKKAAEAGEPYAMCYLAICYQNAIGTQWDDDVAEEWLSRADEIFKASGDSWAESIPARLLKNVTYEFILRARKENADNY